ncbi:hypothetical protein PPTG_23304 [Phytophthora nicotianae INRA-310]|uniref:ATP-dependent DNA helicase n=1 Tax=Phytophthora nicotianae (strain INRA-310) TaxID=761204 RepID=W2Q1P5_PHYN3|nr:hypothetical protein PPTG_23304 [Phytophthora nicotianae INRA-310]ETN06469.1 hypothetical protein PPTG_23304 [Phytophthora nicotianae INRA-310]
MKNELEPFGGKVMVFSGGHRQILPTPGAGMRPIQLSPQRRKISAAVQMSKHPSSITPRRRLKSNASHSNLLRRLLAFMRFFKRISVIVQRLTLARPKAIIAVMYTPGAQFTNELDRMELLPPSLPRQKDIGGTHGIQEQTEDTGLADKAVAWMLAPVFFCCVVAEKAKPPHTWKPPRSSAESSFLLC